jgi:catechol 2,3-dioxygenase-like lactoylglutathione lyase family enzyme
MEHLIAKLLQEFEQGKISRRQLVRNLALTATGAAAVASAPAAEAEEPALKAVGIHHISYQVKDYAKSRDFYSSVFGMKVSEDNGKQCFLSFGDNLMTVRTSSASTPLIDHIGYAIDPWNTGAALAELKRRGLNPQPEASGNGLELRDPDGYRLQLLAKRA